MHSYFSDYSLYHTVVVFLNTFIKEALLIFFTCFLCEQDSIMCPLGIYNLNGTHPYAGFPIALYYELVLQIHIVRNNQVESQWMQFSLELGIQGRENTYLHKSEYFLKIAAINWFKWHDSYMQIFQLHFTSQFKGTVWKMVRRSYRWNYKKKTKRKNICFVYWVIK